MGRRDISERHDMMAAVRMIGGQEMVDAARGRTDREVRQMIEAAFASRAS